MRGAPSLLGRVRLAGRCCRGLLACVAYLNALDNPFVYDDHDTVIGNRSLVDLVQRPLHPRLQPVPPAGVNVSYALDRWLWDYRPFGYHLTNVALHAASVVLLYAWIRRVLERRRADGRRDGLPAFAGAAALCCPPVADAKRSAYVSGRSEVLCAVWFLGGAALSRARNPARACRAAALAACVRASRARIEGDRRSCFRSCSSLTTGCFGPGRTTAPAAAVAARCVPVFVLFAGVGGVSLAGDGEVVDCGRGIRS